MRSLTGNEKVEANTSILALAQLARHNNYTRPHILEEDVLEIIGGRHPLQEQVVASFVPNDTKLGGMETNDARIQLLTGANFSGKSVYLKQVAMIVFLAQVGSFVPAEHATLGICDRIMTRVQTRESVSRQASAFMIDLQQIAFALQNCTARSLLVVDEFGKGTDSADGAGLFCGLMDHLQALGGSCPKVLAATHYHELLERKFLVSSPMLQFAHMEILLNPDAPDVQEQCVYLYRLAHGMSMSSFGTW